MICFALSPSLNAILRAWNGFQPHARIDVLFQNRVRIFGGDLLDLHAARGRRHENRLALGAVDQDAEVKFFLDGQRFFDQQPAHDAALGTGLVRHQFHAQHFAGEFAGLVHRLGDLDAAALAAAAGVDLRFDYDSGCAGAATVPWRPLRPHLAKSAIVPRGTLTPYFFRIAFA